MRAVQRHSDRERIVRSVVNECSGGMAHHGDTDDRTQRGKLVEQQARTGSHGEDLEARPRASPPANRRFYGACSAATLGAAAYALMRDGLC
jgi:hypothetical protein